MFPTVGKGAISVAFVCPFVCPSVAYIANNSRMQRPSVPKFGRKVHLMMRPVSRSNGQRSGLEAGGGIPCRSNPNTACLVWRLFVMPPPGRRTHYVFYLFGSPSVHPFVRPSVRSSISKHCEDDILNTNEPISMQIGKSGPRDKHEQLWGQDAIGQSHRRPKTDSRRRRVAFYS